MRGNPRAIAGLHESGAISALPLGGTERGVTQGTNEGDPGRGAGAPGRLGHRIRSARDGAQPRKRALYIVESAPSVGGGRDQLIEYSGAYLRLASILSVNLRPQGEPENRRRLEGVLPSLPIRAVA
ncbi:hypothetical protein V493_01148 [Pseudogymnoascus sp. VKM F-4281 (FW-2241)]|nr:hypothetical protein V493_01148 [Pseudogymnoascus sp. VKM F-4281 (FW-2241)]